MKDTREQLAHDVERYQRFMADRIDPQSTATLRQLVNLHGMERVRRALRQIEEDQREEPKS